MLPILLFYVTNIEFNQLFCFWFDLEDQLLIPRAQHIKNETQIH